MMKLTIIIVLSIVLLGMFIAIFDLTQIFAFFSQHSFIVQGISSLVGLIGDLYTVIVEYSAIVNILGIMLFLIVIGLLVKAIFRGKTN